MFWNILRKESKVWSIFQKQYQQYLCTLDKFLSIIFQNDPVIFKNNWAKNRIWLWMCFVPGSVLKIKHVLSTPLCVCWNTANENIYFESVKNFFFFLSSKFFITGLKKSYLIFVMKVCQQFLEICEFDFSTQRYLLTLSWRRPLSYRNQSIDLPVHWFALQINGLVSIWQGPPSWKS